jgi:hypothetical protein
MVDLAELAGYRLPRRRSTPPSTAARGHPRNVPKLRSITANYRIAHKGIPGQVFFNNLKGSSTKLSLSGRDIEGRRGGKREVKHRIFHAPAVPGEFSFRRMSQRRWESPNRHQSPGLYLHGSPSSETACSIGLSWPAQPTKVSLYQPTLYR